MIDDWEDEIMATDKLPEAFKDVDAGTYLTIKKEFMRRGGQGGEVINYNNDGATINFLTCGICGAGGNDNCHCYATMEFWEWSEIEPPEATP